MTQPTTLTPNQEFEDVAQRVLRKPQFKSYTIAALKAPRRGRPTAMHREIVQACALIARELTKRGWTQHAIAAVFCREHSTVGLWLKEKEA